MRDINAKSYLIAALIVAIALIPLVVSDSYLLHLFCMTMIYVMFASSYNILLSTGQLSLGHNAFFGIGAYTSGILAVDLGFSFIPAMLCGGVLTCLIGLLLGRITLKMRGSHFVLVTFAFAEIVRLIARNWVDLTRGPMALRNIPVPNIGIPGLFDFQFMSFRSLCYLLLVFAAVIIYVSYRMLHSRYGRSFSALRTAEDLAESTGISHLKFVTVALVVSTFFTGITGSLYAHYMSLVSPEIIAFDYTIMLLIMVIGGGRNTVTGPIVGAVIFTLLPESLRGMNDYRMLIFGIILILVVLFMPDGIVPKIGEGCRAMVSFLKRKGWFPGEKSVPVEAENVKIA